MKSGSSSLTYYLHEHPDIFMASNPKEPSYFLTREQLLEVYPVIESMGFWDNEEKYLGLYDDAGEAAILGDASQNYARLDRVGGVAQRIHSYNPDARILYLMRDPIERTISHYWYMVELYGEGRPMLRAIREDPDYCDTSYYAKQIRPYLELFGPEQVCLLTTEELRDDPVAATRKVFQWLGVDPDFQIQNSERRNVTANSIPVPRGLGLMHRLRHSRLWEVVGPRIPKGFRKLGRSMAEKPVERKTVSTADVEAYLRPIQEQQTQELEQLTGRRFEAWTRLRPRAE